MGRAIFKGNFPTKTGRGGRAGPPRSYITPRTGRLSSTKRGKITNSRILGRPGRAVDGEGVFRLPQPYLDDRKALRRRVVEDQLGQILRRRVGVQEEDRLALRLQ